ncbi:MAG: type II toxin-antitoxin system HipA family toxin [Solirubrobacteraceae bacterium]
MSDSLHVLMGDAVAGTLTRSGDGRLRFEYDDEYRRQPNATPLSLSMPVQLASHADHVVTPWLWGLLPDNDAVLRRWARHFHTSSASAFSLLATPVGEDCAGAVRFLAPEDSERAQRRTGAIEWLSENDVAMRLRELREDSASWLGRAFTGQFSLAGAQAKTALHNRDGRWGQPSGATPTTHILKPAVAGLDDHDLNEHLCLDAARRAGLIVARTRIARFEEETAVVVTRYDRSFEDQAVLRVHQEDVCQALSIPPTRKYQNEGGPTAADVATLLRRSMLPAIATQAVERFADALIWNWLIGGTDAHAKNYSLLLAGRTARLAPLYDIASALPYGTYERKLRLAMKIGGSYDVYPRRNTWPAAARELRLDPGALVDRVRELAERAPDAFADAAKSFEVLALERELPATLSALIADRADRCAKLL